MDIVKEIHYVSPSFLWEKENRRSSPILLLLFSFSRKDIHALKSLTEIPLGAYANAGDPFDKEKSVVPADEYSSFAKKWKQLGARVIGGCCGTNPMYIMKLRGLK